MSPIPDQGRAAAVYRRILDAVGAHVDELGPDNEGRTPYRQFTVANADVPPAVISYLERFGPVLLREAGRRSGMEPANDEIIQVRMYETIHQQPRSVIVLATGDGAGWTERRGFIPALEVARQHRWAVEVVSWGGVTNGALIDWVRRVGSVFIDLEAHYYSVTFVERGRRVQPVSLVHRGLARL